jgi:hypothetical protein
VQAAVPGIAGAEATDDHLHSMHCWFVMWATAIQLVAGGWAQAAWSVAVQGHSEHGCCWCGLRLRYSCRAATWDDRNTLHKMRRLEELVDDLVGALLGAVPDLQGAGMPPTAAGWVIEAWVVQQQQLRRQAGITHSALQNVCLLSTARDCCKHG